MFSATRKTITEIPIRVIKLLRVFFSLLCFRDSVGLPPLLHLSFLSPSCLRIAFLVHQALVIPGNVLAYVPFEQEVGSVAKSLAEGQGFCCLFRQPTGPTAWLVPVYPLLLAGIFKVFGVFTLSSFYAAAS